MTPPQEGYGRRGGPGRYTRSRSRLSSSFLCKERTKETPIKIELCSILEKRSLVLSFKKVQDKNVQETNRDRTGKGNTAGSRPRPTEPWKGSAQRKANHTANVHGPHPCGPYDLPEGCRSHQDVFPCGGHSAAPYLYNGPRFRQFVGRGLDPAAGRLRQARRAG